MAKQEHLEMLKQGVEAWNAWREEHRFTADFANVEIFLRATYLQHRFDDPAVSAGWGAGECAHFRYVRDQIGKWIEATFSHSH